MAYMCLLGSVPESQVLAMRADAGVKLQPSLLIPVSHLIAYWVVIQPLGGLLGKAIDGGEMLNENLVHPFRSPSYHNPESARMLYAALTAAWQEAIRDKSSDVGSDTWYRMEIGKALQAFGHAAGRGECLVNAIEPRSYIFSAAQSE
jgi:hypothetical protein